MINLRKLATLVAFAAIVLSFPAAGMAQETVVVEEVRAEVLKVFGNSVFIRNDQGEIKRYSEIPEGVRIVSDGEEIAFSDLREGMILTAVRIENIPEPTIVTMADVEAAGAVEEPEPEPVPTPAPAEETPAPQTADEAGGGNMLMWGLLILAVLVVGGMLFMRKSQA